MSAGSRGFRGVERNHPFGPGPTTSSSATSLRRCGTPTPGPTSASSCAETADIIHELPDGALDLAYIDGDHTLRGITIDLVKVFPKVRAGGWIGGDDLSPSIWQHSDEFEPTLVCPFAIYFAEAVSSRIYALPHKQFLTEKTGTGYELVDLMGRYRSLDLRSRKGAAESGRVRRLADRIRQRPQR